MPQQTKSIAFNATLVLICVLGACKNQRPVPKYSSIELGQGGGITGHYTGYTLMQNRLLYHWEQPREEERIILDSAWVDSSATAQLFKKMNGLENQIPGMVKPGAMGSYIQYFSGDSATGYWVWGADGMPPGRSLSEFWEDFHRGIKRPGPAPASSSGKRKKGKRP